jgi:hypothetical protein
MAYGIPKHLSLGRAFDAAIAPDGRNYRVTHCGSEWQAAGFPPAFMPGLGQPRDVASSSRSPGIQGCSFLFDLLSTGSGNFMGLFSTSEWHCWLLVFGTQMSAGDIQGG